MEIIGVDQGYGYVKTSNCIFPAGVGKFDNEPPFLERTLFYKDKYYTVGSHPDGLATAKTADEDYYVMTLAAVAEELSFRHRPRTGSICIAAGLPLTTFSAEKAEFEKYLFQDEGRMIDFMYEGKEYHIRIEKVFLYPQGYAAIIPRLAEIKGACTVVDIGTGTTDILPITSDKIPDLKHARTIPQHGISTCIAAVNEQISRRFSAEYSSQEIIDMIMQNEVQTNPKALEVCIKTIEDFATSTLNILRQNKVNYNLTQTFICGGGAALLEKHAKNIDFEETCITFLPDIRLNAKGYEALARSTMKKTAV